MTKSDGIGEMTRVGGIGTIAPLKNVAMALKAMEDAYDRLVKREDHEAGMICLHGPAGFGKTFAATYVAMKYRACYIRMHRIWTVKDTFSAMAQAVGLAPESTASKIASQVIEYLQSTQTPLIIDEMGYLVQRDNAEIVRDIYDSARTPIMMIGEERLPNALKAKECFESRVLGWLPAQPADFSDAKVVLPFYARRVAIAEDLLREIAKRARGSMRRITMNIARIETETLEIGKTEIDLAAWAKLGKGFWTGEGTVRGDYVPRAVR